MHVKKKMSLWYTPCVPKEMNGSASVWQQLWRSLGAPNPDWSILWALRIHGITYNSTSRKLHLTPDNSDLRSLFTYRGQMKYHFWKRDFVIFCLFEMCVYLLSDPTPRLVNDLITKKNKKRVNLRISLCLIKFAAYLSVKRKILMATLWNGYKLDLKHDLWVVSRSVPLNLHRRQSRRLVLLLGFSEVKI